MARVLLIRHGETSWNRERRWQGHADVALSPAGLAQATRLAAHLLTQHAGIARIYSSDLRRASDTASEVARVLGVPLTIDRSWREIRVGRWTGLNREEIQKRFAAEWQRIVAGEDLPRGGGETFGEFSTRAVTALAALAAEHAGETVAVVTHGGVIRALLLYALGLPFERLREVSRVANTALTELVSNGGGWTVLRRNDLPHLDGAAAVPG
ncbi:MAG: histidine phosphatase family protein [Candidatus Binatia bacterium]